MLVGYKLVDKNGATLQEWGGVYGISPHPPNPIVLPNGDTLFGAVEDTEFGDYKLIGWYKEAPPPVVPDRVTPRQARLLLLQQGLLAQAEQMIAAMGEEAKITWEFATEITRNHPMIDAMAQTFNLTSEQIDQFFIAAAAL